MENIDILSKKTSLLKQKEVKKIVSELLDGYKLSFMISPTNNEILCKFVNDKNKKINLTIFGEDIIIEKPDEFKKEIIKIVKRPNNLSLLVVRYLIEERQNGIIITTKKEYYSRTIYSNEEVFPVDLYEYRYVFTKDNIHAVYDNITPMGISDINRKNIDLINYNLATLFTTFEAHMRYYYPNGLRAAVDSATPTKVFFNEKDFSRFYDMIDGSDKLKRVSDLYNGIINETNREDIKTINLGFMSSNGFDLRGLEGITNEENMLVGRSLEPSQEYQESVKKILKEEIGYLGTVKFDRKFLVGCIKHNQPIVEQKNEEETNNKVYSGLMKKLIRRFEKNKK